MTHEFMATMLGSRRSGVTIAATTLQKAGFTQYHRGHITVLDRAGLEATTCECYGATTLQFGDALRPSTALPRPTAGPFEPATRNLEAPTLKGRNNVCRLV
ncbi:MAG: helix-turn-helix domain-containing protein [Vulcanimicrobiaceae bacterium]